MPRVWLLNFDADDELANPSARTSSRATLERSFALRDRIGALVPPGDMVLTPGERADGLEGRAFCPTPTALAALTSAGAKAPLAPSMDVLRRVNHRRFCAELGQTLEHARFVTTFAEVKALLSIGGTWLAKRPFSYAGRGRQRIDEGSLTPAQQRWVTASLARGDGLQVEPYVKRAGDFALHGYLTSGGALTMGEPTEQRCDDRGAWLSTERATAKRLTGDELDALSSSMCQTAAALQSAGYFGPFGVDAFRYLDAEGLIRWNPRCEINARYSMGWAAGMGDRRPDLAAID